MPDKPPSDKRKPSPEQVAALRTFFHERLDIGLGPVNAEAALTEVLNIGDPRDLIVRVTEFVGSFPHGAMAMAYGPEKGDEVARLLPLRLVANANFHSGDEMGKAIQYFLIIMEKTATRAGDMARTEVIGKMLRYWMANAPGVPRG